MTDDRHKRSLRTLESIDAGAGRNSIDALRDSAPDLAHHAIAYIYSRPGLASA